MVPWLFALLLVLLLIASPYPIAQWSWDNVPGGNPWYLIVIAATVGFFLIKKH